MKLTRIYQGRVSTVEVKNTNPATKKEVPWLLYHSNAELAAEITHHLPALRKHVEPEIVRRSKLSKTERKGIAKSSELVAYEKLRDEHRKEWQAILRQHHEYFQDAVNYYFAVFAGMVPEDCEHKYWHQYRKAVERSWNQHDGRKHSWPHPFAAACKAVGLSASASFIEFREKVFQLTGNHASEQQRFAALAEMFRAVDELTDADEEAEQKLGGVAKNKVYGQEFVTLAAQEMDVPDKVTKGAQKNKARELILKVRGGSPISWNDVFAFKTHPDGTPWLRKGAVTKLKAALTDLLKNLNETLAKKTEAETTARTEKGRTALTEQKQQLNKLVEALSASQPIFAAWLEDQNTSLPTDEPTRTGRGAEPLKAAMLFALRPDLPGFREVFLYFNNDDSVPKEQNADCCSEARNAAGIDRPVFPQFLDAWSGHHSDTSIGYGVWPHFEKAAFIEVFNKVGQFQITGRDFDRRLAAVEQIISAVEGEMSRDPKSKFHDVKALTEDLAEGIVGEDGQERRFVIRDRTLKAWSKIAERWRAMLKENPAVTAKDLVTEKNTLQRKFREKFGSAAMFEKLAQERYRRLWDSDDEDYLNRWSEYEEALAEKEHLTAGQKFSPAHPEKSPRYFRWSESTNREHFAWQGMRGSNPDVPKAFKVRVDAFDFARKTSTQLMIHFSAPRLLRNGLRCADEKLDKDNPDLVALPPALRAVVESLNLNGDKHTFDGTSVRLAPVPDEPHNVQLVFEHGSECKQLQAEWRKRFPFRGVSDREDADKMIGLKWPREGEEIPDWQHSGKVQCLAVDVGITNAAAYQVMRAEKVMNGRASPKGLAHEITPTGAAEVWKACAIANGLVRLPGEDAWVYREVREADRRTGSRKLSEAIAGFKNGESKTYLPELSGAAGRNARPEETEEAERWFRDLQKCGYDFFERHAKGVAALSFPQQNDALLFGLSRLRSQLFRLQRWAEHIFGEAPLIANPKRRKLVDERIEQRRKDALSQISELQRDDPLHVLVSLVEDRKALKEKLHELNDDYLAKLKELLPKVADRVLPTHKGRWKWAAAGNGWHSMELDASQPRPDVWLAGQRGLSYARLRQLKELRQMAQSLNHLCRHKFAKRYSAGKREAIPEPFEGCRQALEDARTDRVKQIAHAIFAAALGVELAEPPSDKKDQKRIKSLHGVYRCLDRGPVNFIALEKLKDYKTSDRQSRRENRQLSEWRHREIHRVLKELCDLVGMPIVYVDPQNTSRFSGKDHSIGFRADEIFPDDPRVANWRRTAEKDEDADLAEFVRQLESLSAGKSLLRPRDGGPVFVSLWGDVSKNPNGVLFHADLNAAYRIGLRALAHPNRWDCLGFFSSKRANRNPKAQANSNGDATDKKKEGTFVIDRFGMFDNSIRRDGCEHPLTRGGERFWDSVRGDRATNRCNEINAARLRSWGLTPPASWEKDNIPM